MNPVRRGDAKKLTSTLAKVLGKKSAVTIVVAPPTAHLADVSALISRTPLKLAVQNVSVYKEGPHTGEVSVPMLLDYKVTHTIVGHSERRSLGETDEEVNTKVLLLLKNGIIPILCVGEHERDASGKQYGFVETQLLKALVGVTRTQLAKVIIAYEPVWAISKGDGKGETATAEHAHEMKLFIQKVLVQLYGRKTAFAVPILYGGSVNVANAEELFTKGEVNGFLVGGASLDAKAFTAIISIVRAHA